MFKFIKKINMKSKKTIIIMSILILSSIGMGAYYFMQSEIVEIDTAIVEEIHETIKDSGVVMSENMLNLLSLGSGRVLMIEVEIGDVVKKDDVLATIDDKDLKLQLEALSYDVQSLESNISYLTKPYDNLTLENYKDSARISKENLENSRKDYENGLILFESGAISKSELESLELLFNINEMNYTMALNESNLASKGSDDNLLQQYSYQLKSLEIQLEMLTRQIEEYVIKAPFDGIISDVFISEDEYVMFATPAIQIYKDEYYIVSNLLEDDLTLINKDTPVVIKFGGEEAKGSIRKIHPTIKSIISDLGVSQLKGVVEIDTDHEISLLGKEVDVEFIIKENDSTLTIDKDAVVKYNGDDYVFLAGTNKAVLQLVTLGIKGVKRYEVLEGLDEGDIIIINPSEHIEDGVKISY
ncbi:MAG: HlyD family efflux transporter periplasmic adaptor subunit [Bacillota bacterium]|nr:HlyD family efflux transporter periplasmic adaptor subunit [Bacillota bacterium]